MGQSVLALLTDVTPDGRDVGHRLVPDDAVDEINKVPDECPSNKQECSRVASLPVPWRRDQDREASEGVQNRKEREGEHGGCRKNG